MNYCFQKSAVVWSWLGKLRTDSNSFNARTVMESVWKWTKTTSACLHECFQTTHLIQTNNYPFDQSKRTKLKETKSSHTKYFVHIALGNEVKGFQLNEKQSPNGLFKPFSAPETSWRNKSNCRYRTSYECGNKTGEQNNLNTHSDKFNLILINLMKKNHKRHQSSYIIFYRHLHEYYVNNISVNVFRDIGEVK